MLTVVSILMDGRFYPGVPWAGIYDTSWVEKLSRACQRNLADPFRFVLLTDELRSYSEPVEQVLVDGEAGMWATLEAYNPALGIERGLLLGLDTVVVGDFSELTKAPIPGLQLLRDPFQRTTLSHSISIFDAAGAEKVWKAYQEAPEQARADHKDEWRWMQRRIVAPDVWIDDRWPGAVLSYKVQLKKTLIHGNHSRLGETLPPDVRIVYFHGVPKQHQLNHAWIREHWQ